MTSVPSKPRSAHEESALGFDCVGVHTIRVAIAVQRSFPQLPRTPAGAWCDRTRLAAPGNGRADPRVCGGRTLGVIIVGVNYGPDESPLRTRAAHATARLGLAQGDDYHDRQEAAKALARWMVATSGAEVKG